MSETDTEYMSTEEYDETAEVLAQAQSDVERYLTMPVEEFGALTVKQRDMILFTLLVDALGETRSLADLVRGYETKGLELADKLKSPTGQAELLQGLMGGGGGGPLSMLSAITGGKKMGF